MDLLQASSDTINGFLKSAVLFSVLYPEEQEKVYKEIQELIPKGETPTYAHSKRMTYTQAFMIEVYRLTNIVPLFANKRTTKAFNYKGYFIKENTNIVPNVHAILNNKKVMGEDTDNFRPQRFIDDDGKLRDNSTHVIPFSIGKRMCPGMAYAEVLTFLFFVNILQKYKLSTVPGIPRPRSEMCFGMTSKLLRSVSDMKH